MRIFLASLLSVLVIHGSYSQVNRQYQNLRTYIKTAKLVGYDSSLDHVEYYPGGSLNYFYPLYQLIREEERFRKIYPGTQYDEMLSEALSFCGDYGSALLTQALPTDSLDNATRTQISRTVANLKDIENVDARKFIAFVSKDFQVIMVNEAPNKPLHRAFTVSLLEDLYKRGFHYLALEMLSNYSSHSLDKLTPYTGYYTTEPVAGEMVRAALDIGFHLISYEDTAANRHTPNERDSIQASNIYQVLKKDPSAKILVHATYGHIAEKNLGDGFFPMAMMFKKISGINPLTIDQTDMTEAGNINYGRVLYLSYIQKYQLNSPSIALFNGETVNITNNSINDLSVIHPLTVYRDGRPIWLSLAGRRQPLYVKPANKNTFFVQAYYQYESFGNKPGQVIPADQTYIPTNKNNYLLYLHRGKYIIIFRDMSYKILSTLHIEVN